MRRHFESTNLGMRTGGCILEEAVDYFCVTAVTSAGYAVVGLKLAGACRAAVVETAPRGLQMFGCNVTVR